MSQTVPRSVVDAFYAAYAARDSNRVAKFLDDDVEWTVSGPVGLLPFCGSHAGKAAVVDLIGRLVPSVFRVFSFVPESIMIDGEQVAMLSRQSATCAQDGRTICFRVANFMRFRNAKLIRNLSLIDSYDAVEQVLGYPLADYVHENENGLVAV